MKRLTLFVLEGDRRTGVLGHKLRAAPFSPWCFCSRRRGQPGSDHFSPAAPCWWLDCRGEHPVGVDQSGLEED